MAGEFSCRPEILSGTAQALLEMKKLCNSLMQSADAMRPIANAETDKQLNEFRAYVHQAGEIVGTLYSKIAREAFQ